MVQERNKNIKSDIIPAHPNIKISFPKKIQMYITAKRNIFKTVRLTSRQWLYYKIFLDDVFKYSLCGFLISLPFFYFNPLTFALSFGGGLYIYSNKINGLLIKLFSSIRFVNIEGRK